ncbi:class III extradiol dioxygenase subunit B-like domain-containing protein [Actinomadura sp. WAC 06369]|uniref:class III extradiol dioxygenase subunit B-like domain-containing protein n=1 Tax=Actinomadura sp. WAC 06369 TaxID=2203193 RepID=UPI0018F39C8F|nr:class III extradiol dioxygenase subunit B-like domain-containing protein [Actinomadura sp. WAC 06369]
MLISAAVCPHPPLLVPAMAGGAAPELDGLRAACDEAVGRLAAARPDVLAVVGGAPEGVAYGDGAYATLRPYGLPWTSPEVPDDGAAPLPLSLTIGRWLVERAAAPDARGTGVRVRYRSVAFDAPPAECLALGRELAGSAERVALLVMGDGSACRSEKAPGYLDERAGPYDEAVGRALGAADAAALAALDPGTSGELRAAGRAAWQVLAGAAAAGRFTGELLADEAPYGVGYLVASWAAAPGR